MRFSETNKDEFETFFDSDGQQIEHYTHNFIQNINENIIDAVLFQTELIFRFYYYILTAKMPGEEPSMYKIIATVYEDTENIWLREEARLIVLFWTLRSTIHTGGIYFLNTAGYRLLYKGRAYAFEYGKSPEFLQEGYAITMVADLLDSLQILFNSRLIKSLGSFDHPSYHA